MAGEIQTVAGEPAQVAEKAKTTTEVMVSKVLDEAEAEIEKIRAWCEAKGLRVGPDGLDAGHVEAYRAANPQ